MAQNPTPAASRVTPERIRQLVAIYASRAGLTGRSPPAVDWTFTVEVVPGLSHPGEDGKPAPAWAVVNPRVNPGEGPFPGGSAHVQVRDIDATPIPGFDGDPFFEIRVTLAHETLHAVVAEAVRGGALTVPAEEQIVEAAAQAIVRSEGTGDARVMARAVRALPATLRARISASAGLRARGATMDPKMIMEALEALIGGDAEKCQEILKGLIASAAGGGAAPPPAGDPGADADAAAKLAGPPAPAGADGGVTSDPVEDARRAKGAEMDQDKARARAAAVEGEKAAAELRAMVTAARPAAKEGLVVTLRARLGAALTPAAEAEIMAASSFQAAQALGAFAEKLLGGGSPPRARSGVEHDQNPGPEQPGAKMVDPAVLTAEGFSGSWINGYQQAAKLGPQAAAAYLEQGRTVRARRAS